MADARNYMAWILNAFGPYLSGPVLEIGVGQGNYVSELRAHGHYMGVDVDIKSVAEARERFPDLDFAVADIRVSSHCVFERARTHSGSWSGREKPCANLGSRRPSPGDRSSPPNAL